MSINIEEMQSKILYEKYRPSTMEEILLPKALKASITKYISTGEIPSLLLYSKSPGVGKTSLSFIICKALDCDYLYINCSEENGIDILRNKIQKFATSISMNGKPKVVILDEFGGATRQLQDGLKAAIESFTNTCRFIFTSNSLTSIIPYIKSRCTVINFDFKDEKNKIEMLKKIYLKFSKILKIEGIECEEKLLYNFIEKFYPDMRIMLNIIQDFANTNNNVITSDILSASIVDNEILDLILNKQFTKCRELVIKGSYNYIDLYRFLYDKLVPKLEDKMKQVNIIMIISEFMWRESFGVMDSEINFAHCLFKIIQTL